MADWATKWPAEVATYTAYLCTIRGRTKLAALGCWGPKVLIFPASFLHDVLKRQVLGKDRGRRESHCWSPFRFNHVFKVRILFTYMCLTSGGWDHGRSWRGKVEVGSTILSYFNATRIIIIILSVKSEKSSTGWCIMHCTPETNTASYVNYTGIKI